MRQGRDVLGRREAGERQVLKEGDDRLWRLVGGKVVKDAKGPTTKGHC